MESHRNKEKVFPSERAILVRDSLSRNDLGDFSELERAILEKLLAVFLLKGEIRQAELNSPQLIVSDLAYLGDKERLLPSYRVVIAKELLSEFDFEGASEIDKTLLERVTAMYLLAGFIDPKSLCSVNPRICGDELLSRDIQNSVYLAIKNLQSKDALPLTK